MDSLSQEEITKQKQKEWNKNNVEKMREYRRKYALNNKEKEKERKKIYRIIYEDKIKEKAKEKIKCDICNCEILKGSIYRHNKSKKHISNMN
tara:strand:+ start:7502 stop:7777 length:276 start_codon:yes stop_codon:yes gene_type:complete